MYRGMARGTYRDNLGPLLAPPARKHLLSFCSETCSTSLSDVQREPMSFTSNPAVVPDRDNLPLKKRDQRRNPPPPQQHQQQCDAATFKAPYPHKSLSEIRFKHTGPFQPVPKRVPALYQPWMHTQTSSRSKPHVLSAFRKHQGWADTNPLALGRDLSHPSQHHGHLSGTFHMGYPHLPSRFSPISPINESFQGAGGGCGWEQLKTLRDNNLNPEWQSNGKYRGLHVRRRDRKVEHFSKGVKATCPSLSLGLPHSPQEDLAQQQEVVQKSTELIRHPISEHSFTQDDKSGNTYTSVKEDTLPLTCSEQASFSSSSPNCFPWLLPHFVAGSLIELGDGRLRRVEHLQTEDFLLGSLACPDLRLSCCTVQSITPSTSSSISRLLILLHDQPSQELVDVYVEYPFFVRGQGWSSCSPQRTALLCGLQCHQLSVGDVCLALTPISAPQQPPSATSEPETPSGKSERRCESLKAPQPQVAPGLERPAGGQRKEAEVTRRRHRSAPELRGQGTNCM